MSASYSLVPVTGGDADFLLELYAQTRRAEMTLVPWSDEQKRMFLKMQFDAQTAYYRERYADASFDIVKTGGKSVGRFYLAELADEIRIIDIALLPEYQGGEIHRNLIEQVLRSGDEKGKPVQIYLERLDENATEIFAAGGFQKRDEHGIYFLWRREPQAEAAPLESGNQI